MNKQEIYSITYCDFGRDGRKDILRVHGSPQTTENFWKKDDAKKIYSGEHYGKIWRMWTEEVETGRICFDSKAS